MKTLIILLALISGPSFAGESCTSATSDTQFETTSVSESAAPKYLEGATITVTLANGKSSTVPAEKFKVVPRRQEQRVSLIRTRTDRVCSVDSAKPHRISVMAGRGLQKGLDVDNSAGPGTVAVENRIGAIFGVQYQYRTDLEIFGHPLSVGVQGQNNKSGLGMIGLDW